LMTLVFGEALVLCVCSAVIGIGIAATLFPTILSSLGVGTLPMPLSVFAIGVGFSVLLALVSSVAPALRAQRLKIVEALAVR